MKFPAFISSLFCLAICLPALAQTNFNGPDERLLMTLGWRFVHDENLAGAEMNGEELTNFLNGFSLAVQDQRLPLDMRAISPDVDALAKERQQNVFTAIKRGNLDEARAFLAHWEVDGKVMRLPDGVCFEVLRGGGTLAKPTQTVKVHYVARLVNGTEVTEFGPDDIILVTNHLNRGLFEGFQRVGVGGKMRLYLPPELAEGQVTMAGDPEGSALVYDIEMFGIKDTPADDLADAQLPGAPDPPPPAYSGRFPVDQVIGAWGWKIAERSRTWQLRLSDEERADFVAGVKGAILEQPLPFDERKFLPLIDGFVSGRREAFRQAFKQKQIEAMNALFARLDTNSNVVKLPDGLRYEIVKPGDGPFPHTGQTVLVNYTGRTLDGHIFDQTANEPLHVDVGRVMPGWNEGIQKLGVGGKIRLYIPPSLGYGSDAVSGIPADSTLIYDIELLGITAR